MTVMELINKLQDCEMTDEVVLAKDAEGNAFNPLEDLSEMVYVPSHGEVYQKELTPDLEEQGYTDEDIYDGDDGKNAVVLWP